MILSLWGRGVLMFSGCNWYNDLFMWPINAWYTSSFASWLTLLSYIINITKYIQTCPSTSSTIHFLSLKYCIYTAGWCGTHCVSTRVMLCGAMMPLNLHSKLICLKLYWIKKGISRKHERHRFQVIFVTAYSKLQLTVLLEYINNEFSNKA